MGKKYGKNCKVTLGANTVVGMGSWSLNGVSVEDIDVTSFGDTFRQNDAGLKDGGTLSFEGWWDADDVTGAEALRYGQNQDTDFTDLRFYVDNTSYFVANQTSGYWSPTTTSGADTPPSTVRITSCPLNAAIADVVKINFEAKVDGIMVLV